MKNGRTRVVVTGMGTVNPLGKTLDQYWDGLIEGRSGARLVEVALGPAPDGHFAVEIRDDGRGAESDGGHRAPGLGTLGMRERALILGGRLEIETAERRGTTVRVILAKEQLI